MERWKKSCEEFGECIKKHGLNKAMDIMFAKARREGRMGICCTNNIYEQELEQDMVRAWEKENALERRKKRLLAKKARCLAKRKKGL